ncbi:bromodomain adjacent to zinc finger domain protein 1A-like [Oppia nitens]|uniref:bromodomain adjacent to zinc finger domain protein 1A-like n=1 Tax=Oppia nitens TaxID=1686743 RepID=UPI0023DA8CB9|nr:bromodomain adjacent to zinc finger domain protein 1A-like [Oppia nitens]
MPLLGREPFVPKDLPINLDPEDEVFYCKTSGEAFLTYDEFSNRQLQLTSMVWTCEVTGRQGLTFAEAVESERKGHEMLATFPAGIKIPSLFLMRYLCETNINAIVDKIYAFINNRYFIAEDIEIIIHSKKRIKGRVFRVIAPTDAQVKADKRKSNQPKQFVGLSASLYRYEIIDCDKKRQILAAGRIVRSKNSLTKDRLKMFLKRHLNPSTRTDPWTLKDSSVREFNLMSIYWNNIFAGPVPRFMSDSTLVVNGSITTTIASKEMMAKLKILAKADKLAPNVDKKLGPKVDKLVIKVKETKEERRDRERRQRLAQKELEKQKKRQFDEDMKLWNTKRDDLACDDLQPLPEPIPVNCKIPVELFADSVFVMEFLSIFKDMFNLKSIFPMGSPWNSFELMEQILVDVNIYGPFVDLLKVLISTNLTLLEDEGDDSTHSSSNNNNNHNKRKNDLSDDDDEDIPFGGDNNDKDFFDETVDKKNAVYYYHWIQNHFGVQLSELNIDSFNITEVLRLHLLSSGGGPQPKSKYRGLYSPREDPSIEFVAENDEIMKKLESETIFDLTADERLKIFSVLIHQLLTYFEFRDKIEDASDEVSKLWGKIRRIQMDSNKWIKDNSLKRLPIKELNNSSSSIKKKSLAQQKSQQSAVPTARQLNIYSKEKSEMESETNEKLAEVRKAILKLQACYRLKPIGSDRAYRKYWIFQSLPGLFVERLTPDTRYTNQPYGPCLPEPTPSRSVKPMYDSAAATTTPAFDDSCDTLQTSLRDDTSTTSDKENDSKITSDDHNQEQLSVVVRKDNQRLSDLDRCTANINTCCVHGMAANNGVNEWSFYSSVEQLNDLIASLNSRGHRESSLRSTLNLNSEWLKRFIRHCPVHQLNKDIEQQPPEQSGGRRSQRGVQHVLRKYHKNQLIPDDGVSLSSSHSDLKIRLFKDYLLTLEEHAFAASLAVESDQMTRDEWRQLVVTDSPSPTADGVLKRLIRAILVLRQCVRPMCLSDLFSADSSTYTNWFQSLSECTSVSQLYIHVWVFEQNIKWSKSASNAYCKLCRRKQDDENMLLCDRCNRGHHIYCLQPPLETIPVGEWLCPDCSPKFRPQSPKKQKLTTESVPSGDDSEDTGDYDDNDDDDNDCTEIDDRSQTSSDEEDDDEQEEEESAADLPQKCDKCLATDSDVKLVCDKCRHYYHQECVIGVNQRITRSKWLCKNCSLLDVVINDGSNDKKRKQQQQPLVTDMNNDSSLNNNNSDYLSQRPKRVCRQQSLPQTESSVCPKTGRKSDQTFTKMKTQQTKDTSNNNNNNRQSLPTNDGHHHHHHDYQQRRSLRLSDNNNNQKSSNSRSNRKSTTTTTTTRTAVAAAAGGCDYALCDEILKKLDNHSGSCLLKRRAIMQPKRSRMQDKPQMNLNDLGANLRLRTYTSNAHFLKDVLLMVNRAKYVNSFTAREYELFQSFQKFAETLVRRDLGSK